MNSVAQDMSRRFCITVYRALASRTGLQLWSGALASRVGISAQGRSRSASTPTSLGAKFSDSRARRIKNWCPSPRHTSAGRKEPVDGGAICCCSPLAPSWKRQTFVRRTARVVQHQSPSPQNSPSPKISTTRTIQASPKKPSKPHWQLVFRLCPRLSVKPRSTSFKQCHLWRRSSTILDMVPLPFLRHRIL